MSFTAFMMAQERSRTAYERYNYAGAALELARIKERLAEIRSQHEPLASMNPEGNSLARKKQYAAAFYVVFGRMPEPEEAE